MFILKIPPAKIFEPLLKPARYKGVYGGRGSGKSHFFGELLVETCQDECGTLAVSIREAQRTLARRNFDFDFHLEWPFDSWGKTPAE